MEAKVERKTKRIYYSLLSKGKRLSNERSPKTDHSSRLSYDMDQSNRRISAIDNSVKLIKEKAKEIFDLCPKNVLNEKSLQYLVELVGANFSTRLLMEVLMVKWSDKDTSVSGNINNSYSKDLQPKEEVKESPRIDKESSSNSDDYKDTILWSIFELMNFAKTKRLRKFAAYFL